MTSATAQKKGPAEVAASQDRGSNNSQTGKSMNSAGNSTAASASATLTATVDVDTMSVLGSRQMLALYDAFSNAAEALHGVMTQPRCHGDGHKLNAAGEILDRLYEFMCDCRTQLVDAAKQATSDDPTRNEERLFLILRHEASMADGLAELAAMASAFVVEQQNIEWDHRQGRKVAA